jgi:hypothetical protein
MTSNVADKVSEPISAKGTAVPRFPLAALVKPTIGHRADKISCSERRKRKTAEPREFRSNYFSFRNRNSAIIDADKLSA